MFVSSTVDFDQSDDVVLKMLCQADVRLLPSWTVKGFDGRAH